MREIKFDFIYKGTYQFHHKKYYLSELINKSLKELSDIHSQMPLVAERQYADLKDKNGVEIYEGDIIQMYSHSFDTNKHEKDTRMNYKAKDGELAHYSYIGDINDIRVVEHRYGTIGLYGKDGRVESLRILAV